MKLFIIGLTIGLILGVGLPALGMFAYKSFTETNIGNEPQSFLEKCTREVC